MKLQLRGADCLDLDLLAEMNQQLIEDEGSSNPMNLEQLKQRMQKWLDASYIADLIIHGQEPIGYALYRFKENEHFQNQREVYLRQYFIRREFRIQGLGSEGIQLLKEARFKRIDAIEIDVLASNSIGKNFWAKVGFQPHVINMRMNRLEESK